MGNFQEFVDINIKIATQVLKLRGTFSAQAVLCGEDDKISIAILAVDKAMWDKIIRDLAQKFNAKYAMLISETWFAEIEKPDEMVLPVRKHPFRKEALVFTTYAKTGEKNCTMIPFDHVDPKTIKLEQSRSDLEFESNVFHNPWA